MKILAVDSSTNVASCAVFDNEKLIGESILNDDVTHSQKLLPLISETLERCKLKVSDIDIFAAAIGPGSFTGLRIGIVTVNSLAQATDKSVVGVSSLESLAQNVSTSERLIVPIIDARRDRVFTAMYSSVDGRLNTVIEPDVTEVDDLLDILENKTENMLFVGEGVAKYGEKIALRLGTRAQFANHVQNISKASSVGELALIKVENNEELSYFELTPEYLRKSQAEREYDEKMKCSK